MFRVTIEEIDETGLITASTMRMGVESEHIGVTVGCALQSSGIARTCQTASEIIGFLDFNDDPREYFPGYSSAIESLRTAAKILSSGWAKHDREFDKKTR